MAYGEDEYLLHFAETVEDVVSLLENGYNVDEQNDMESETALHWFIQMNNFDVACQLIKYGADVNKTNDMGETPIFHTVLYSNIDCFKLLLHAGANVHHRDDGGNTLMHKMYRPELIPTLVDLGLNIRAVNRAGKTPLQCAISNQNPQMVRGILKADPFQPIPIPIYSQSFVQYKKEQNDIKNILAHYRKIQYQRNVKKMYEIIRMGQLQTIEKDGLNVFQHSSPSLELVMHHLN